MIILTWGCASAPRRPALITAPAGFDLERYAGFALSPDRAWIAFVVKGPRGTRLAIAPTDRPAEFSVLDDTERATAPFWSPDGSRVAFFTDADLRTVTAKSGQSAVLCPCKGLAGTWGAGGILFVARAASPLQWLQNGVSIPTSINVTRGAGEYAHIAPRFLPDGRRFLYVALVSGYNDGKSTVRLPASDLYLSDLSGQRELLAHDVSRAVMLDGRTVIYSRIRDNKFRSLDLKTRSDYSFLPDLRITWLDASGTGAVAWALGDRPRTHLIWLDRQGKARSSGTPTGHYRRPRISPDGQFLAYQTWATLVVKRISTDEIVRSFPTAGFGVAFSPDSKRIVAPLMVNGKCETSIGDIESGAMTPLLHECVQVFDWSPDGELIAVETFTGLVTAFRFVSPDGSSVVRQFVPKANQGWLRFSPDGKTIAFDAAPFDYTVSNWTPDFYSVYVVGREAIAGEKAPVKLVAPGNRPAWTRVDSGLLFVDRQNRLVRVAPDGPMREEEAPPLSRSDTWFVEYDITPDGKRIVVNQRMDTIVFVPRIAVSAGIAAAAPP